MYDDGDDDDDDFHSPGTKVQPEQKSLWTFRSRE